MIRKTIIYLCFVISFLACSMANAQMSYEQKKELFEKANDYFREANSHEDLEKAEELYSKAILSFNKLIEQGNVKNAKLYYNIANAYFLNDEIGMAILNYRRAEMLDGSDENIKKNLEFARSKRIDEVAVKTEKRVLQTLFFWHYDFSVKTKFILTCVFFGLFCIGCTFMIRKGLIGPLMVFTVICVILTICFLSSVFIEYRNQSNMTYGVITAKEVIAHQADWQDSPPSFKAPLHEGTEFDLLESRSGWLHIRLSDGNDGWIPEDSAELI